MYKYLDINDTQIYFCLLLLTFNIPLQLGKRISGWELLIFEEEWWQYTSFGVSQPRQTVAM